MERKIGEIFGHNGEWFQCLEEKTCTCFGCDFRDYNCDDISLQRVKGSCQSERRKDNKSVIFKKLEKVGESFYSKHLGKSYQRYKIYIPAVGNNFKIRATPVEYVGRNEIWIEIKQTKEDIEEYKMYDAKEDIPEFDKVVDECLFGKQELNKEDMEEKKVNLDKLVTDYTSNKITYNEFEKALKELYADKEEIKPILKEFDIEAAKAGKSVCTRDGRKARIICFDRDWDMHIVALVADPTGETVHYYLSNGKVDFDKQNDEDLMMSPERKSGWIVINKEAVYDKETAEKIARETTADVIRIQKIYWEE